MSKRVQLLEALQQELAMVDKAKAVLDYSYQLCKKIGLKAVYSNSEQADFEALTSRFGRLSDLLLQKVWRSLFLAELEEDGSVLDRIHRAEKKGLIASADDFVDIRILRNYIAHEYDMREVIDTYRDVLQKTPVLLETVQRLVVYIDKTKLLQE